MNTPTLRYAVLGMGGIAQVHLNQISALPGVKVVGLNDTTDPTGWRVPPAHAAVPRFQDAEKLLAETKPDLVSVCTPNKFHHGLTLLALKHGAHVVCEKPMAMSRSRL